jgi:hypothetical protein
MSYKSCFHEARNRCGIQYLTIHLSNLNLIECYITWLHIKHSFSKGIINEGQDRQTQGRKPI